MKKGYSDISIILDRSGSMSNVKGATIEGFNKFLKDQKEVKGDATILLAQFDDVYEIVYENKNIKDAPMLNDETYQPRAMTALLDAIGKTINNIGIRLGSMQEKDRPEKVIFVIQTDGYENASKEFSKDKINEMISHQKDNYNWEFVFLGANQDAISSAKDLGIDASHAMTYSHDKKGTNDAYWSISNNMSKFRSSEASCMAFVGEDRKKQEKNK